MNIIVCIKQVPASSNVKVDPVTGVLIRDGIASKMNPYDLFALEAALSLRESPKRVFFPTNAPVWENVVLCPRRNL